MNIETKKFLDLISNYPRVCKYWSLSEMECDHKALKKAMETMNYTDFIMAKFFLSIWHGNSIGIGFDIQEAAIQLDKENLKVISDWLLDPYWPHNDEGYLPEYL